MEVLLRTAAVIYDMLVCDNLMRHEEMLLGEQGIHQFPPNQEGFLYFDLSEEQLIMLTIIILHQTRMTSLVKLLIHLTPLYIFIPHLLLNNTKTAITPFHFLLTSFKPLNALYKIANLP